MAQAIGMKLKTSRYRKLTAMLNQLDEHKRIAQAAGYDQLADKISSVLMLFERDNKEAILARGKRKPVKFDEYGRSYTLGKRKESAARVWMIAVKDKPAQPPASSESEVAESVDTPSSANDIPVTNIIINNVPLIDYLCVCFLFD